MELYVVHRKTTSVIYRGVLEACQAFIDDLKPDRNSIVIMTPKEYSLHIVDPHYYDQLFRLLNIDEANFSIKQSGERQNDVYFYCNLDDKEFQFGEEGSVVTNYKSKL